MNNPVWKFLGNAQHLAMWWSVENLGGKWCVVESYNQGKTWTVNCHLDSAQACWDFIAAWFAQFYEGE